DLWLNRGGAQRLERSDVLGGVFDQTGRRDGQLHGDGRKGWRRGGGLALVAGNGRDGQHDHQQRRTATTHPSLFTTRGQRTLGIRSTLSALVIANASRPQ